MNRSDYTKWENQLVIKRCQQYLSSFAQSCDNGINLLEHIKTLKVYTLIIKKNEIHRSVLLCGTNYQINYSVNLGPDRVKVNGLCFRTTHIMVHFNMYFDCYFIRILIVIF